jgi:hypothetical protein
MTIHFCQKYKPVFLTKGKSFLYIVQKMKPLVLKQKNVADIRLHDTQDRH